MIPRKIDSLQHPLVKRWVRLRTDRAAREEEGRVMISGERTIRELASLGLVHVLIATRPMPDIAAPEVFLTTAEVVQKVTGLAHPDGVAAEVSIPPEQDLLALPLVAVFDRISDPGNLGTLLRSALALGWDGAVMTPETTDPFNDKALRAAKGASFRLPRCTLDEEAILQHNRALYVADARGRPLAEVELRKPLFLVLGHETRGVCAKIRERATLVAIPMQGKSDSLNVASAGAILFYAIQNTLCSRP